MSGRAFSNVLWRGHANFQKQLMSPRLELLCNMFQTRDKDSTAVTCARVHVHGQELISHPAETAAAEGRYYGNDLDCAMSFSC